MQTDRQTGQTFSAWYAGPAPSIPGVGTFCLAGANLVVMRPNEAAKNGDGYIPPEQTDPSIPAPQPSSTDTFTSANYRALDSASACVAGSVKTPDAAMDIVTYARGSTNGQAWKQAYMEQGEGVQADPLGRDLAVAGVQPVTFNGQTQTAYLVNRSDRTTSALLETTDAVIIVSGPFTKATLQAVLDKLVIR